MTAWKRPNRQAAANVKNKTHLNDPSRKPSAKHNSVQKATRARAAQKAANLNTALPDRASGPRAGAVTAKQLSKPKDATGVDQFGNKLESNNDSFFDAGAEADVL
jgi:hypothetical protein